MWTHWIDERLFPRDQSCRPYWSVSRAYFLAMAIFLVGVTVLQLIHLFRLVDVEGSSIRTFGVVFLAAFLLFQLTVTYLHSISVACLHHAGGTCKSLAQFWLVFAALHQISNSVLPLIPASIVASAAEAKKPRSKAK